MAGRADKVAAQIRKDVASLVLGEMRDPRLVHVTITGARMNRDLTLATVAVSVLGGPTELAAAVDALNDAAGWVRQKIAPGLRMRHVPEFQFVPDDTAAKAQRLEQLLQNEASEFGGAQSPPGDAEADGDADAGE